MTQVEAIAWLRSKLVQDAIIYAVLRGRSRRGGSAKADFFLAEIARDPAYVPPKVTGTNMLWINRELAALGVIPDEANRRLRGQGVRLREPLSDTSYQIVSRAGTLLYGNTQSQHTLRLEWL